MRGLYPPIEPFDEGFVKVSDLHTVHYEQVGNPKGKKALFLHGGPAGGLDPDYRRYFDPKRWHLTLIDEQRGSGKSTPHAELRENTTWDLVADIERIREKLGIDKWLVFGGSWGSTLALAYAETPRSRSQTPASPTLTTFGGRSTLLDEPAARAARGGPGECRPGSERAEREASDRRPPSPRGYAGSHAKRTMRSPGFTSSTKRSGNVAHRVRVACDVEARREGGVIQQP